MTIPIKRREPGLGPNPDYSCAFYCDPPSHDFCVWIVIAELMRRRHGAPAPLRVKFGLIDGQLGKVDFGPLSPWGSKEAYRCNVTRAYSDQMLENVLRPAIAMMGAVEEAPAHETLDERAHAHWVEYDYHIGHLVDAGRQGHVPPKWQVPQWAHDEVREFLRGTKPVVITLRETDHQRERNSRIDQWLEFGLSIKDKHPVLFLRDTAKADEPFPFETWPRASTNVYVRAALYNQALCNLMVCNGPNTWVIFSDAPYLIFKELIPELPNWHHGQPQGWREQDHMEVGDQYAWASPLQRLTWTDDTFENIKSAFEAFIERKGATNVD